MVKILSISRVQARLDELVSAVQECEDEVIIKRNGKPAAILMNYAAYQGLKETLDVLGDPEMMRQIRESEAYFASGKKGLSFEEVFGEPLASRQRKKTR